MHRNGSLQLPFRLNRLKDLLTDYNGEAITYDTIGNPLTIGSKELSWNGRQLAQLTNGDNTTVYAYNGDGQRISKTVIFQAVYPMHRNGSLQLPFRLNRLLQLHHSVHS